MKRRTFCGGALVMALARPPTTVAQPARKLHVAWVSGLAIAPAMLARADEVIR